MVSWQWPSDFPENCPPSQASPANGTFYRIVKTDTPQSSDFVSVYHDDRDRAEQQIRLNRRTRCEAMGLSIYASSDDAVKCARRFKNLGNRIAQVSLISEAGKIQSTAGLFESHNTWWKTVRFDPLGSIQSVQVLDATRQ